MNWKYDFCWCLKLFFISDFTFIIAISFIWQNKPFIKMEQAALFFDFYFLQNLFKLFFLILSYFLNFPFLYEEISERNWRNDMGFIFTILFHSSLGVWLIWSANLFLNLNTLQEIKLKKLKKCLKIIKKVSKPFIVLVSPGIFVDINFEATLFV